jgi:hypothetical protein
MEKQQQLHKNIDLVIALEAIKRNPPAIPLKHLPLQLPLILKPAKQAPEPHPHLNKLPFLILMVSYPLRLDAFLLPIHIQVDKSSANRC